MLSQEELGGKLSASCERGENRGFSVSALRAVRVKSNRPTPINSASYSDPGTGSTRAGALITHLLPDYLTQLETFMTDPMLPREQEIARVVRWAMVDTVDNDVVHVFRELWIMALREEEIRRKLDEYYPSMAGCPRKFSGAGAQNDAAGIPARASR
jgi:hypothetical protein